MTSRRRFVEECGKAAAAFVFMAACEQEKIVAATKPRPLAMGVSIFCDLPTAANLLRAA